MPTPSTNPYSYHRWLRFSLRTFLLTVVLLSIALAWLANTLIRVRHQRALVAEIKAAIGTLQYEHEIIWDGGDDYDRSNADPPGHYLVRQAFGDDVFAHVATVTFHGHSLHIGKDVTKVAPKLKQLPRLWKVAFVNQEVTPEGLAAVAEIPSLRQVGLLFPPANAVDIRPLQAAKKLKKVVLIGPWIDDAVLHSLGEMPQLECLMLTGSQNSAAAWQSLSNLSQLRGIDLIKCPRLGPDDLQALAALPRLETVSLDSTPVDSSALIHLSKCRELRSLSIRSTSSLEAPASFENWRQLETLKFESIDLKGPLGPLFSQCKHLRELSLPNCQLTDTAECLTSIARQNSLTSLNLRNSKLTDDGLTSLQTLTNLRLLQIGPNVTIAEAQQLQRHLPRCQISIDAPSGQPLHTLPALQK